MRMVMTQEDIDGAKHSTCECPLSRTFARLLGSRWKVGPLPGLVWEWRAENEDGGRVVLPLNAVLLAKRFDACYPIQPVTFEVDI